MRLAKRQHAQPLTPSMTPMIDIVFLLIIFLMTQPLSKSVDNHPVELSVVSKLKNPENDLKQLVINIDQDGGFFVSGKLHSMSAVSNLIDRKLEKVSAARLNILLRVDKRTRTETINEFMTMLERRGIKQVRVSARSEN